MNNTKPLLTIFVALISFLCACSEPYTGYVLPDPHKQENQKQEQDDDRKESSVLPETETPLLYSISTGPGADASNSICVSWAADLAVTGSRVFYTTVSDSDWKNAVLVSPEQNYLCSVFNGVASVDVSGKDMTEKAEFNKCGATLSGLEPDTDYQYAILTEDGKRSRIGRFKTAGAREWSCCLISDFHSYPPIPKRLASAMGLIDKMETFNNPPDWVLSSGDVVAWGGSYSFWKRFFEEDNCATHMWARANGNHDNWTKESQETGNYNIPNDYFKGTSFYPQNGYPGEEGVCYSFRYGNTLFIMLNTEDMSSGKEFNAAADWMKSVVSEAGKSPDPPVFTVVCLHYEWFYGTNGKASEYSRWHSVFDQTGVDLAFAGNNHVYLRSHPLFNGKVTTAGKGTVYIQTPSSDDDRGRSFDKDVFQNKELIAYRWTEGSHTVGAIHMQVSEDRMTLTLIDRNGNKVDSTQIVPRKK